MSGQAIQEGNLSFNFQTDPLPRNTPKHYPYIGLVATHHWIFHISAGEFCDAPQKALLNVQRARCDRLFSAMGSTTIAELEKATAQMVAGYKIRRTGTVQ
jgi:hypothetical protein